MATCTRSSDLGHASPEERSLQVRFAELAEGISDPISLTDRLYSVGMLDRNTRRAICSSERPRRAMLDAVERRVAVDPQNFYKFIDEMEDPPMRHLRDKLRSTCDKLKSQTPQLVSSVFLPTNTSDQLQRLESGTVSSVSSRPQVTTTATSFSSFSTSTSNTSSTNSTHIKLDTTCDQLKKLGSKITRLLISFSSMLPTTTKRTTRNKRSCVISIRGLMLLVSFAVLGVIFYKWSTFKLRSTTPSFLTPIPPPPSLSSSFRLEKAQPVQVHNTFTVQPVDYNVKAVYAQHLERHYQQSLPDDETGLIIPNKYYIELAVISSEDVSHKEANDFTNKSLHGLTEEILKKKAPIKLKDILKPGDDGKPVRCVLVEGAPGSGKSTLAWELCHKWKKLESVKQFDLVILVKLREKRAQGAHSLSDLFARPAGISIEQVVATIGDGKGVLIILDGFDELPHEQRQEGSVYIQLIKGDLLSEATVIVTSRPSVSADLMSLCQRNIDRRLEIVGFTKDRIDDFSRSVFSDSKQLSFQRYINGNPFIKGMMYLPLNAVFVASIFKYNYDDDSRYPNTMTELYDAITRSLIRRHLLKHKVVSGDYHMPRSLQSWKDISRLPSYVLVNQLLALTKVAYEGLLNEVYIFTDLGKDFNHLGMMKKTTSMDDPSTGPTHSYSFHHLTLQEYLSTLHMVLNGLCLDGELNEMSCIKLTKRDMVLRFFAGLCKHSSDIVCDRVADLVKDSSLITVRCVYESDRFGKTQAIQRFFNKPLIVLTISITFEHWFSSPLNFLLTVFDYYLIGHCISHHGGRWSIEVTKKDEVDLLIQGLQSGGNGKGKIRHLTLNMDNSNFQNVYPLLQLCHHSLRILALMHVEFSKNDINMIKKYISPGSALQIISLNFCPHTDLVISILFGSSSLNSLAVIGDNITNTDALNLLIQEKTNLNKLTIKRFHLTLPTRSLCDKLSLDYVVNHTLLLVELLRSNNTIEELKITTRIYMPQPNHQLVVEMDTQIHHEELLVNKMIHIHVSKLNNHCPDIIQQISQQIPRQYHYLVKISFLVTKKV